MAANFWDSSHWCLSPLLSRRSLPSSSPADSVCLRSNYWIIDHATLEASRTIDSKYASKRQLACLGIYFANRKTRPVPFVPKAVHPFAKLLAHPCLVPVWRLDSAPTAGKTTSTPTTTRRDIHRLLPSVLPQEQLLRNRPLPRPRNVRVCRCETRGDPGPYQERRHGG
jgi:hypothetical protein